MRRSQSKSAHNRVRPGKVWKVMEFKVEISRFGKSRKITLGMEKFGKVMEFVTADLEN